MIRTRPLCNPRSILMLKGHSAGVGDLLRSSAAWRALRDRFPEARLHLLFLTKDPGAAAEELIARHHLLDSFHTLDKRTRGWRAWRGFLGAGLQVAARTQPELIVDFESAGLRTSLLALAQGRRQRAATVGIAQVPGRGFFYSRAAGSVARFAQERNLPLPLEYTYRDFVALAALGIERKKTAIELTETPEGARFRLGLRARLGISENAPLLGLNIGCGTPDAVPKRPNLDLLSQLVAALQARHGAPLVLTGAPYEAEVNREFGELHRRRRPDAILDLAGQTSLLELTGVINTCDLFISSDSGPYHMAVALRKPTLALFRFENRVHYHSHPWVRCLVADTPEALPSLVLAVEELWKHRRRELLP